MGHLFMNEHNNTTKALFMVASRMPKMLGILLLLCGAPRHLLFARHPLEMLEGYGHVVREKRPTTMAPVPLEWTPLGPGLNGPCMRIVQSSNGWIYAGGSFTQAGGQTVNHIASWDGSNWMALGWGVNDDVWGIAIAPNGDLYVVGNFTQAGGQAASYIARWDGNSWSDVGGGLNGPAYDIAVGNNGDLFVVGAFTQAGGQPANYIARWDGSSWSSLGSGLNGEAYALAIDNAGNVYVGGAFTQAGNTGAARIAKWNGNAFSALGSGLNANCYALHVAENGLLYAGGEFTQAGGLNGTYRIAEWNGGSWSKLGTGLSFWCMDIKSAPNGEIYAAGLFMQAGGQTVNHIGKWDGTSWSSLGGGTDDWIYALWHDGDNTLFAGGEFLFAGGVLANYIGQWTTQDPPPGCTFLLSPANGATHVSRSAILSWNPVGNADGYFLTAGTCPTCTDIANNLNLSTNTYDPPGLLPCLSQIYVTVVPYNQYGMATGCMQESFTTVGVQAAVIPDQTICGSDSVQLWADGGVQYRWSPAQGLSDPYAATPWASPATTTQYTVTVFDFNGCSDTASTTVFVVPAPDVSVLTTAETANGAHDGTATAQVDGGTPPYSYLWSTGDTSMSITGLAPGIYTVSVTDQAGCEVSASGIVDSFVCPVLMPVASFQHPYCSDSCSGTIQIVEVVNAQPPLSYTWNNGSQGSSLSALCSGTYAVTIADAANCTVVDSFLLIDTVKIQLTLSATPETGYQYQDGTATVSISGGLPPYQISWHTGDTTAFIDSLAPGWYFVSVADSVGCFSIDSVLVDTFACPPQHAFFSIQDATCPALCNGMATLDSLAAGLPPFQYLWSNGDSSLTADSLCAGTWTVTIADSLGCIWTDTIQIADTSGIALSFNLWHESANQAHDGRIEVVPTGGIPPYSFNWSTGDTTALIDSLAPGLYTVTVTDLTGCSAIDSAQVLPFPCNALIVEATVVDADCAGSCSGQVQIAEVSGGFAPYTYSWSNGDTGTMADSLCMGLVTVQITDSLNCSVVDTFSIAEPLPLYLSLTATAESGLGFHDGAAAALASGGTPPYSYLWSTGDTSALLTGLAPGWYYLTVSDAHGCVQVDSTEVLPFTCPNLQAAFAIEAPSCHNTCDGQIQIEQVEQGAPPFSYLWSTGDTSALLTGLCAGTYALTLTDTLNCTLVDTLVLQGPPPLVVSVASTPESAFQAHDGTASAQATGGTPPYAFSWHTGDTTQQIGPLAPGIYSVTVTDAHGCLDSAEVVVEAFGCPTLDIHATLFAESCFAACDGLVQIDSVSHAVSPLTFAWSHGDTSRVADSLCAGTYSLTITDGVNCSAIATFQLDAPEPVAISFDITPQMSYGGTEGAIAASVTSGIAPFQFSWQTGDTVGVLTALDPGWYVLSVTDARGCMAVDSAEVPAFTCPPLAIAFDIDSISCHNACDGSLLIEEVEGGAPPFAYVWNNNATTPQLTDLCEGSWSVTITDAVNCTVADTVVLVEPAPLLPHASATPETAYGAQDGTAWVAPSGGTPPYSVVWSSGDSTLFVDSLPPGIYLAQVTDAHGCTATQAVVVVAFDCPELEVHLNVIDPFCTDSCNGVATVVGMTNGVMPFTYEWSDGTHSSQATGLCAGTYSVTVVDSKNCSASDSVVLEDPPPLVLQVYHTNESGYEREDGMAWAEASGGVPPYILLWSTGAMNQDTLTHLAPGLYGVTLSDAMGCMAVDSFEIAAFLCDSLWLEAQLTATTCADTCNGAIEVLAVHNGLPPFTFLWAHGDTSAALGGLCAGTYSLNVIDADNCMAWDTFAVLSPPPLTLSWAVAGETAPDAQDGSLWVEASGGTPPYSILWESGDTSWQLDSLAAGAYAFTVTDSAGCQARDTIALSPFSCYSLQVQAQAIPASCQACTDGQAWASSQNGMPPFAWSWSHGATDSLLSGLPPGTYSVTMTDAYGCSGADTVLVEAGPVQTAEQQRPLGIRLSPNPFAQSFSVALPQNATGRIRLRLWNLTGRPLTPERRLEPGQQMRFETSHLPKGVYLLELAHPQRGRWYRRLVKQ